MPLYEEEQTFGEFSGGLPLDTTPQVPQPQPQTPGFGERVDEHGLVGEAKSMFSGAKGFIGGAVDDYNAYEKNLIDKAKTSRGKLLYGQKFELPKGVIPKTKAHQATKPKPKGNGLTTAQIDNLVNQPALPAEEVGETGTFSNQDIVAQPRLQPQVQQNVQANNGGFTPEQLGGVDANGNNTSGLVNGALPWGIDARGQNQEMLLRRGMAVSDQANQQAQLVNAGSNKVAQMADYRNSFDANKIAEGGLSQGQTQLGISQQQANTERQKIEMPQFGSTALNQYDKFGRPSGETQATYQTSGKGAGENNEFNKRHKQRKLAAIAAYSKAETDEERNSILSKYPDLFDLKTQTGL